MVGAIQEMWSLGFWQVLYEKCLCDRLPIKIMGTKSLTSVPGRQHFTMLPQIIVGGNKHILWDSAGRAPLELVPSFLQTSPRVPFTFAEFAFCCNKSEPSI